MKSEAYNKTKVLIVNADDFGMSKEVTDGILASHQQGIVTSTSIMANMPDTERALQVAKSMPSLDFGIHLNVTQGRPVLSPEQIPTIVSENGEFYPDHVLTAKLMKFMVDPHDLKAEFAAQINRIVDCDIALSHINSHHHIHIYPFCAWAIKNVAMRFNIKAIRSMNYYMIHISDSNNVKKRIKLNKQYMQMGLKNIYRALITKTLFNNLSFADYIVSPSLLFPKTDMSCLKNTWVKLLKHLPYGICEVACHPGYMSQSEASDSWSERRNQELNMLTSKVIKDTIKTNHINLISFKNLY